MHRCYKHFLKLVSSLSICILKSFLAWNRMCNQFLASCPIYSPKRNSPVALSFVFVHVIDQIRGSSRFGSWRVVVVNYPHSRGFLLMSQQTLFRLACWSAVCVRVCPNSNKCLISRSTVVSSLYNGAVVTVTVQQWLQLNTGRPESLYSPVWSFRYGFMLVYIFAVIDAEIQYFQSRNYKVINVSAAEMNSCLRG